MTATYIQSMIHPPIMPQRIVSRNRLLELLQNNIDKNLILVYSPAGYGKTTLIQNFISKQNLNFGWLNVTGEIDHMFTFFKYLVYSLARINKKFGKNTLEIIESWNQRYLATNNPQNAINDITSTFIKEFGEVFNDDIILVLDDLQYIEDSKWFKESFNTLFDVLPRNLHLVLITRQLPNFNMLPLMEKGNMLKIGMEDLIFRFDEIIELLKEIYSIGYTEDSVRLLENNLGGWITGIHLILKSYGKDFNSLNIDYQKIPENIFNILAGEIFEQLNGETQNLLVLSSLLQRFNPDICKQALDIKNSEEIIKSILDKNLFVQTIPVLYDESNGYSESYNYQILFKIFLNQKANELYTDENLKNIYKRVYKYYCDRGDIISAIDNIVKTKDYTIVIPAIIEHFDFLFEEGKFEFLWKWVKQVDNEIDVHNPYIIYYLGLLYKYFIGDLGKSLDFLNNAVRLFEKHNDQNALANCHVMKASVLMNLGRTNDVIPELTQLLDKQTTPDIRSNLLFYLALAYYQTSEFEKSVELLNEALGLAGKCHKSDKQTDIYNLLGNISLIKGNFKTSVPYYEKALGNNPDLSNKIETLCNLVLLSSQSGDLEKAKEFMSQLELLFKKFPTPIFQLPYLLTKQGYYYESGKYEENIKLLEELNSIAKYTNHKPYLFLSYRLLIDSYYYQNKTEKAYEYLHLSEQFVDTNNELDNIELETLNVTINGKFKENSTEKVLLKAYEYYKINDYTYSMVQIGYKLANWYIIKNNKEQAKKFLEESLSLAEKNNYISYFIREYRLCSSILQFCLDNNLQIEFINSIIKSSEKITVLD